MKKAGVIYNLTTREIDGLVKVPAGDLLDNYTPATQGLIEVALNHPIFSEQEWWFVNTLGQLERKTSVPVTPKPKWIVLRKLVQLTLDEIYTLRALHGLPPRTMTQVLNQIEE